jgi:hypothetical protein
MASGSKPIRRTSVRSMTGVGQESPEARKPPSCLVCGGSIKEKVEVWEDASRHSTASEGLHCTRCGLKYEFPPPDGVKRA